MTPVVHHIELCVSNGEKTLAQLEKFGFYLHAQRTTPFCQQWVIKIGGAVFIVTERKSLSQQQQKLQQDGVRAEPWTVLCCETADSHQVDTVFNVALRVKNVDGVTKRIVQHGGQIIQEPTSINDESGVVTYSIVRSCCGNVVHTLLCKDDYDGFFLPGFQQVSHKLQNYTDLDVDEWDKRVTHVDHVTLACHQGDSQRIIKWYEKCFGMQRFNISRNDDEDEGLILEDGVGLRLKAMEYWRCAETGLTYPAAAKDREMNPNGVMLVVVESLPGQMNCNVETFLKEHEGPGVEHIALSTTSMLETIDKMIQRGVLFRQPPSAYYNQKSKVQDIHNVGHDVEALRKLGILVDCEVEPDGSDTGKTKYLMQIFAQPLFDRKTFFIEVIQRHGARGLGAGNILALVRSFREEAARKLKMQQQHQQTNGVLETTPNLRKLV